MRKFIFEELMSVKEKQVYSNIDWEVSQIDKKTNTQVLTDINNAAKERNANVTIGSSNETSITITNYSDSINKNIVLSTLAKDEKENSDYMRVKYFFDILNKTYSGKITWTEKSNMVIKTEAIKTNEKSNVNLDTAVKGYDPKAAAAKLVDNMLDTAISASPTVKKAQEGGSSQSSEELGESVNFKKNKIINEILRIQQLM